MGKECGRPECKASTGICGRITHGTGELDSLGYWEEPCEICEEAEEARPKKPVCELIGTDGNVFALLGKVTSCLKRAKMLDKAQECQTRVMGGEAHDYDHALQIMLEYVEVE